LTVGADGIGSTVGRLVSAPTEREGTGASAFIYGYWSDLDADGYEWFYNPGGTAGMIPTNGGQVCVFAGSPADRFRAELAADVRRGFHRILGEVSPSALDRVVRATAPPRIRTFPGRRGFLRRPWGPGWALVGDAGYFKDPISTHGLTDAFRDAELLTAAMAGIDVGSAGGLDDALARYHADRDRLSCGLFETADAIARYEWDLVEIRRLLRAMSASMSDEVDALLSLDGGRAQVAARSRAITAVAPSAASVVRPSAVAAGSPAPASSSAHS
jgi:2-polyprenyl-6-methoxyphenol hydroxylase-like FAD-dependent oxidoreductase